MKTFTNNITNVVELTDIKILVKWDGVYNLEVHIPDTFKDSQVPCLPLKNIDIDCDMKPNRVFLETTMEMPTMIS
jgi:hypothetical protein